MSVIELGVHVDYVSNWGVWEGVRELVQNGIDGDRCGYRFSYTRKLNGVICLKNDGAELTMSSFLVGFSTKRDDDSQIGEHGEGLKLALLALVREGFPVKIRTGSLSITPEIRMSKSFGCDVLVLKTRKVKPVDGVFVEIGCRGSVLSDDQWQMCTERFLDLSGGLYVPPVYAGSASGRVLRGSRYRGRIYARGIFVRVVEDIPFGFDLNINLNRDRDIPDPFEMSWSISTVLSDYTACGLLTPEESLDMIIGSSEARYVGSWASDKTKFALTDALVSRYGEQVKVVHDPESEKQAKSMGYEPVLMSQSAAEAFYDSVLFSAVDVDMDGVTIIQASDMTEPERVAVQRLSDAFGRPFGIIEGCDPNKSLLTQNVFCVHRDMFRSRYANLLAFCAKKLIDDGMDALVAIELAVSSVSDDRCEVVRDAGCDAGCDGFVDVDSSLMSDILF